jgi:hypothetical protein
MHLSMAAETAKKAVIRQRRGVCRGELGSNVEIYYKILFFVSI